MELLIERLSDPEGEKPEPVLLGEPEAAETERRPLEPGSALGAMAEMDFRGWRLMMARWIGGG